MGRIPKEDDQPTYRRTSIRRRKRDGEEAEDAAPAAEAAPVSSAPVAPVPEAPAAEAAPAPKAAASKAAAPKAAASKAAAPKAPARKAPAEQAPVAPVPSPAPAAPARPSLDADALLAELDDLGADAMAALLGDAGPQDLEPGDTVTGPIVRVTGDTVFVDLGGKSEAWIPRHELGDDEDLSVGAALEARVLSIGGGGLRLTRSLSGAAAAEAMEAAMEAGIPMDGRVESRNPGGFVIALGGTKAFCPISHIDRHPGDGDALDAFIGLTLPFRVLEVRGRDVVVSHRLVQDEEAEVMAEKFWQSATVGDSFEGVVAGQKPYGVFVDIGGVTGLLHKRELGWDDDPTLPDRGTRIRVRVVDLDRERKRISLSMKDEAVGPWTRVGTDFLVGEVYPGKVVRLTDFGAFVQLAPGLQGMVHVSNLAEGRVEHPSDVLKVGDRIDVRLLSADRERERLELGLRQAAEGWEPDAEGARGSRGRPAPRKREEHREGGLGTFADLLGGLDLSKKKKR